MAPSRVTAGARALEQSSQALPRIRAIDGLRAIAVLAVMLFHAGVPFVKGGFLGVDLFFVISGFLICQILLDVIDAGFRSNIGAFWLRRARRLFPALFFVLLSVGAWRIAFIPSEADAWRTDILAATFYATNWLEVVRGSDYFAQFAARSPLLHTWSLSIEEQFYLVFPVLLTFGISVASIRRRLPGVLLVAGLCSAIWMLFLATSGATVARLYYSTDTRAQTLLVGAALGAAYWQIRKQATETHESPDERPRFARSAWRVGSTRGAWFVAGGLTVMLVLFVTANESSGFLYRGGFLLTALAGAAVITGVIQAPHSAVTRALESRWLVAIGLISYGLYLWHWPVFLVIDAPNVGGGPVVVFALRFLVTFGLAVASYFGIERRIRSGSFTRWPQARQWLTAGVAALVVVGVAIVPVASSSSQAAPTTGWPAQSQLPTRVFVAGDSVMLTLYNDKAWDQLPEMKITSQAQIGCGLIDGTARTGDLVHFRPAEDHCSGWEQRWRDAISLTDPQVSVLQMSTWDTLDRSLGGRPVVTGSTEYEAAARRALESAINIAGRDGTIPVYLTNIPCYGATQEHVQDPQFAAAIDQEFRQVALNKEILLVAAEHPNTHVVDLRKLFCPSGTYQADLDGAKMRSDGIHTTPAGSMVMWQYVMGSVASTWQQASPSPTKS